MSVARLSSSLARPARRRAVQTWSCIESTAIVTCTPAFAGSSSQQTGHRRKRALPQASDDRAQVAPGSHGHAKRDGTRIRANHADPHHYAQTRMSRPPPHVHGKEGVDGSSPSEGFWRLARRCEDRRALVADLGAHSVSAYGASVRMRHVHFSPNQLHAWPTPWLVNSSEDEQCRDGGHEDHESNQEYAPAELRVHLPDATPSSLRERTRSGG
jgi:hypothetical protein